MKRSTRQLLIVLILLFSLNLAVQLTQNTTEMESYQIATGKYLASSGEIGLGEWRIAPLTPLLYGGLWLLGLESTVSGKVAAALLLTIAAALFAAMLQRQTKPYLVLPGALLYGALLLTIAIPPMQLGLHQVLLMLHLTQAERREWILAGAALGLASLTLYTTLLLFLVILTWLAIQAKGRGVWSEGREILLRTSTGMVLVLFPYLMMSWWLLGSTITGLYGASLLVTSNWLGVTWALGATLLPALGFISIQRWDDMRHKLKRERPQLTTQVWGLTLTTIALIIIVLTGVMSGETHTHPWIGSLAHEAGAGNTVHVAQQNDVPFLLLQKDGPLSSAECERIEWIHLRLCQDEEIELVGCGLVYRDGGWIPGFVPTRVFYGESCTDVLYTRI